MFVFNYNMTRLLFFCLLIFAAFTACTEYKKYGNKIENADRIELYFKDMDTVYHHDDSSKEMIKEFVKVLNSRTQKAVCPAEGEIRFYLKDSMVFLRGFSISGGSDECNHIMWKDDAWRLTYRAGMFLNEILAEKRKRK